MHFLESISSNTKCLCCLHLLAESLLERSKSKHQWAVFFFCFVLVLPLCYTVACTVETTRYVCAVCVCDVVRSFVLLDACYPFLFWFRPQFIHLLLVHRGYIWCQSVRLCTITFTFCLHPLVWLLALAPPPCCIHVCARRERSFRMDGRKKKKWTLNKMPCGSVHCNAVIKMNCIW